MAERFFAEVQGALLGEGVEMREEVAELGKGSLGGVVMRVGGSLDTEAELDVSLRSVDIEGGSFSADLSRLAAREDARSVVGDRFALIRRRGGGVDGCDILRDVRVFT